MSDPRPGSSAAPQLLLLLMIVVWGGSYAAVKVVLDHMVPPLVLVGARFWLAVLCLLPLVLRAGRFAALASTWRAGVPTGAALLLGYSLQTFGMRETTASMGGFLSGLIVLLVAAGARAVFGERLRRPTIAGLLLGFVGLALLCLPAGGDSRVNTLRGVLLQVGSSCSYAAHILMISRLSPAGREVAYCMWQLAVVAVGATLLAPLAHGPGALGAGAADPVVLGAVAYLGVLATALGIAVQSRVQPQIRAGQVAVLFATQPAFAALAGALVLGERLDAWEWTGGALIMAGLLVASAVRGPRPARSRPDATAAASAP